MLRDLISFVLAMFWVGQAFSQDKKDLKISLASGIYNNTHTNAKPRQFYSIAFDHYVTQRHIVTMEFTSGQYRYYDSTRVTSPIPLTTPGYEKHTNAEARSYIFTVLYKYKLFGKKRVSINAGSGLGIVAKSYTYPVDIPNGGFTFETSGEKGVLCFPIRVDIDYHLIEQFQIGILAGMYIYPDYPTVGQQLGIRFSYILK
jgi:hypothetical protein